MSAEEKQIYIYGTALNPGFLNCSLALWLPEPPFLDCTDFKWAFKPSTEKPKLALKGLVQHKAKLDVQMRAGLVSPEQHSLWYHVH